MPRTQIATPDLTALFSGGVAPPAFEPRENRCETTDMADDRAPYVQSSGILNEMVGRDGEREDKDPGCAVVEDPIARKKSDEQDNHGEVPQVARVGDVAQ